MQFLQMSKISTGPGHTSFFRAHYISYLQNHMSLHYERVELLLPWSSLGANGPFPSSPLSVFCLPSKRRESRTRGNLFLGLYLAF
jgi:hypothetical protein